jgi:phosphoribosylaminoimidazole-succinocarboxamide synthase
MAISQPYENKIINIYSADEVSPDLLLEASMKIILVSGEEEEAILSARVLSAVDSESELDEIYKKNMFTNVNNVTPCYISSKGILESLKGDQVAINLLIENVLEVSCAA